MVTALCRFTTHGAFIPSSTSRITSEGTSRTVEVIGATVTVWRYRELGRGPVAACRAVQTGKRKCPRDSLFRPSGGFLPRTVLLDALWPSLIATPVARFKILDMQTP